MKTGSTRTSYYSIIGVLLVLALPGLVAFAYANFQNSELTIDTPASIAPDTEYDFGVTVHNNDVDPNSEWIYKITLTMPSVDYIVDEYSLTVPAPLHPLDTDYWEASLNPSSTMITWQIYGQVSPGDIRAGEQLSFNFTATTDEVPTDQFLWRIYGDQGTVVTGWAVVGSDDDDDYVPDDDDDVIPDDDDDYVPDDDDDVAPDDDDFGDDDFGDDDDQDDDDFNPLPGVDEDDESDDDGGCCG